jgi:hypothetical protein
METLNNYKSVASTLGWYKLLIGSQKSGLDPPKMVDVRTAGAGVTFSTKAGLSPDGDIACQWFDIKAAGSLSSA